MSACGWTHWWIDPDGNVEVLPVGQVSGAWMPPVGLDSVGVFDQAGERRLSQFHGVREVFVPIGFADLSESEMVTTLRAWARRLNTVDGTGIYRRQLAGLAAREIVCSYVGGFELEERSHRGQIAAVTLRAHEPYWRDIADTVDTFAIESESFFPILPVNLIAGTVLGDTAISNDGDVESWPVWEIQGPGDSVTLENVTTGATLVLNQALGVGDVVTIDTSPGVKTVTLDDGTNYWPYLTVASELWPLAVGSNAVTITMPNATTVSRVTLRRRNRYLTP